MAPIKRKLQTAPEVPETGEITKLHLKAWRGFLAWSQKDAASWLGVKLRTYESWEAGRSMRHPDGVRRLMAMAISKRAGKRV